ncbi:HAD family hydrolase [Gammaproteobacteria bacterium]|nr:HAD family hydrolase [Gammaproteobacteria bacterium]
MSKDLVFDFDGVIFDTAFEAFRIACASTKLIDDPFSLDLDNLYPEFMLFRPYVGPAWNYYYVLENIIKNKNISHLDWNYSSSCNSFEKEFFLTRKHWSVKEREKWLNLQKPYTEVINILQRQNIKPIILTNKNKESVVELLENENIAFEKVISMTQFPQEKTKGDVLNEELSDSLFFIDDHYPTIADAVIKNKNPKRVIKYANWGYGSSDCCRHNISLTELEKCIEGLILSIK